MKNLLKDYNFHGLKRVIKMMGNRKKIHLSLISLFCLTEIVGAILIPLGTRGLIRAISQSNIPMFWQSLALILTSAILWWIVAPLTIYFVGKSSSTTMRDISADLSYHIFRLPMTYHDKKANGEFLSALSNDLEGLRNIYYWGLFKLLQTFTGGVAGLIVMAFLDWRFALVVFSLGIDRKSVV